MNLEPDPEWDGVPVLPIKTAGLVFTTDHDWNPPVAFGIFLGLKLNGAYLPIKVYAHDGRLFVVDGRHRLVGHLLAGRGVILAKVKEGHDETCPCKLLT